MSSKSIVAVRLAEKGAKATVSPARKKFNTLVKTLEAERARLAAWQETLPLLHQLAMEFVPLAQAHDTAQKQLALLLDRAHGHKSMGKRNKDKLEGIICSIAFELLEQGDDAELAALLKKHGGDDAQQELLDDNMFADLKALFGDPDAAYAEEEAARQAMEDPRQESGGAQRPHPSKPARPAKASARQLLQEQETAQLKLSVREIYRKLASALHPDREPDEAERVRKTGLMQRVNAAYKKEDLLSLLELQLEVEQIDQAGLDNLPDERIKQYNKVLQGQVTELERDNFAIERTVDMEFNLQSYRRPKPEQALRTLREELEQLRQLQAHDEQELASFQDIKTLKAWLNEVELYDPNDEPW